jgi:ClpP class serine protease
METASRSSWDRLLRGTRTLLWIALALIALQQLCGPMRTSAAHASLLDRLQQDRSSRVIAMIHWQDTVSLFGVPVSSSIGIEDSEAVLRAIRLTPPDQPIGHMAASSIVKLLALKPPAQISDGMLVLADMAQKARVQVATFVAEVLLKHLPRERADALAAALSEGRWTHDFPITVDAARQLGLPVSTAMPPLIYELMVLYPQSGEGRPSVMYVPLRRTAPGNASHIVPVSAAK